MSAPTLFGLRPEEYLPVASPLRPALGADGIGAVTAFARGVWTVLSEPGDQVAGDLIETVGPTEALERLETGVAEAIGAPLGLTRSQATAALQRWLPRASAVQLLRAFTQASRFGIRLLIPGDDAWPEGFAALGPKAPHAVWIRGELPVPGDRMVAVVGARAATGYGEHVAYELAGELADRGLVIVSGGAYGIDSAAHRAALAAEGRTVAVMAGGLDRLYPAGNEQLLQRVAAAGALLAEVPCGTPPTRFRFLARNRLLAAISAVTVVIEAGTRSGSLNTAGHAAELGRPLGAVPGPVTSPASAGCHRLLREFSAACITGPADVLELLGLAADAAEGFDRPSLAAMRLLDAMGPRRGRSLAELARLSGLTEDEIRRLVGPLELEGLIRREARGWVRNRVPGPGR